jgi:hypothetical protein
MERSDRRQQHQIFGTEVTSNDTFKNAGQALSPELGAPREAKGKAVAAFFQGSKTYAFDDPDDLLHNSATKRPRVE